MKRINPDEKKYLVYKVSDWGLYYFNDPNAEIYKIGLTHYEAFRLCDQLNGAGGLPYYKCCHEKDWNQQMSLI